MLEDSLQSDQLQKLTLPQIFQQEDLVMEEILGIKDIHQKIKRNMEIFTDYCREKHSFTERLIMLGLKCPMHQSNNQNMKNLTFIAADLLTSQHQSLADLFILPQSQKYKEKKQLQNGEEIEEFIETDVGLGQVQEQFDKYKFLRIIFDYIATEELDENCLNYITKALNILIRRKISQFLEYFSANQAILKQLIEISIFPSIAHFLAKLLADDEEKLSNAAFQTKRKIIPLILQKFHRDIGLSSTFQILECIEDVLNSTRYCDLQQRSSLQKLADLIVSGEEIAISLNQLLSSITSQHIQQKYFNQAINSASYLSVVINRMNMDEQQDFNLSEIQEFRPTQTYEINQLYSHFCAIIVVLKDFWQFKPKFQNFFCFALNKIVQPLVLMSKHSRFGYFYGKIDQKDRRSALEALIYMTCLCNLHGILLQSITTLLEKMLAEEEKMTESSNQIVNPGDLYSIVSEYGGSIGSIVNSLFQESTNQRNRNQNGIYFRKILLLLDNYFNHTAVLEKYPNIGSLQTIFPAFNKQNCQIFAQKAAILNHPDGERVKQITQFQFIKKNKSLVHCLQSQIDEFVQPKKQYIVQIKKQPITNPAQMKLKLGEKLKAIKERVKEKKANKGQENNLVKQNIQVTNLNAKSLAQPSSNSPLKQQQSNNNSDSTHNRNKRLFFLVKLLMIY